MNPHIQFMDPSGKVLLEKILEGFPQKIGRAPENDISVPHPSISRFHCRIELRNGKIWLVDLDSVNGIRFQNERVKEMPMVGSLDFKLGEIRVLFRGSLIEATGASDTMEATRVVGSGKQVEPASGINSIQASSEQKISQFTLSNISKSGSSLSGLTMKVPSPQVPGSEDATVVRRPVKPVALPGTPLGSLPELKKPGTGFEDSTQTSFQLRSGASAKNLKDVAKDAEKSGTPEGAYSGLSSEGEAASGIWSFLKALRGLQESGEVSLPWFKKSWSVGIWIGAGFLFAFALSWWGRHPTATNSSSSTTSSIKIAPAISNSNPSRAEVPGEDSLRRHSGNSSRFWSRSGSQAESLEKFLERIGRDSLDSRAGGNEP